MVLRKTAMVSVLMFSVLAVAVIAQCDDAATPLPEDVYPYADVILTADKSGNTLMTFKGYGEYVVDDVHPDEWFTETYSMDSNLTIRDASETGRSLTVVLDGASIKALTLINVDDPSLLNTGYSIRFEMYSGSVQSFSLVSIDRNVQSSLSKTYGLVHNLFRSVDIILAGGEMGSFNPTAYMVSVSSMNVAVKGGMEIDRFYTTGNNGKYTSVAVSLDDGRIGYMTNIASKIGSLKYDLKRGSIDYLCLGSNTEGGQSNKLESMATSFVTGDFSAVISPDIDVRSCVIGGGVLNMPNILWNGETITDTIVRNVTIDAPGLKVSSDSAFLADSRVTAYRLDHYRIGDSPSLQPISSSCIAKASTIPTYAENGVWTSISEIDVTAGVNLYLNVDLTVPSDGCIFVDSGGSLYNIGFIALSGSIVNQGSIINTGIIECKGASTITGIIEGDGFVADHVKYGQSVESINVFSSDYAVSIEPPNMSIIRSISVCLYGGGTYVTLSVPSGVTLEGDRIILSLKYFKPASNEFLCGIRVDVKCIDQSLLDLCSVSVTLSVDDDKCIALCAYDPSVNQYNIFATSEYENSISADVSEYDKFFMYEYVGDDPHVPTVPIVLNIWDYIILAMIVAVIATSVYIIITMRRY